MSTRPSATQNVRLIVENAPNLLEAHLHENGLPPVVYQVHTVQRVTHGQVRILYRATVNLSVHPRTETGPFQSTEALAKGHAAYYMYVKHSIGDSTSAPEDVDYQHWFSSLHISDHFVAGDNNGKENNGNRSAASQVFKYRDQPLRFHVPSHNKVVEDFIKMNGGSLCKEEDAVFFIFLLDVGQSPDSYADKRHIEYDTRLIEDIEAGRKGEFAVALSADWVGRSAFRGQRRPVETHKVFSRPQPPAADNHGPGIKRRRTDPPA